MAEDSSSQSSLENWVADSLSPQPSLSSIEFEPRKDTGVGTPNIRPQGTFPEKDRGKQIKDPCKEFSQLTVSNVEAQEDKSLTIGRWLLSVGNCSRNPVLS